MVDMLEMLVEVPRGIESSIGRCLTKQPVGTVIKPIRNYS